MQAYLMSSIRTRLGSFAGRQYLSLTIAALLAEAGRKYERGADTCTEPHLPQLGLLQTASLQSTHVTIAQTGASSAAMS